MSDTMTLLVVFAAAAGIFALVAFSALTGRSAGRRNRDGGSESYASGDNGDCGSDAGGCD